MGHDALGLDAMGSDIEELDALELDSIEPDKEPNAMVSDIGLEVLCGNLLVWHFFLDLFFLSFKKGALGSGMPT
jgi:hypothetical protein